MFGSLRGVLLATAACATLGACATPESMQNGGIKPLYTFPVTSNDTPYSTCLSQLAGLPGFAMRPAVAVGEISDKTGQVDRQSNSTVLSQGATEMMISALFKTEKVQLVERFDLRIPLAEMEMGRQGITAPNGQPATPRIRTSNFVIVGALTELNYNITSGGVGLWVGGVGAGMRTVVINVGLDVRVINSQTFEVGYANSLQKQIFGYEVEANVFRFFDSRLVEFDAGRIQNEPLQLGVRSVVEMAAYQIMTDYLGLPSSPECALAQTAFMSDHFNKLTGKDN